ncbi:MAG: TonB-dependent receptor, partial [Pseudomonadota bacterium]
LKRSEVEGPTPVLVFERQDFENQGYRTVQDVLDSLTQNTGGSLAQTFVFGFTPAASGVNLRGFGTGRTLILVDGRRVPVYPLGIGGTTQFYDTATIPTAIIERIEVLTDGASAIYGSDAIGGVVNIITRKEFDGIQTRLRAGDTSDGGYQTEQIEFVAGKAFDETSVYFTIQYDHNDALMSTQRSYAESDIADPLGRGVYSVFGANTIDLTTFAITPDPNCGNGDGAIGTAGIPPGSPGSGQFIGQNTCGFNRTAFRQLFPENRRVTLSGRVEHEMTDDIKAFASFRYNRSDTFVQIEPFAYGSTSPNAFGGGAANPLVPGNGGVFPGPDGAPTAVFRRLVEFGPRTTDAEIQSMGALFGLQGTIGYQWDWEAGYSINKQDFFSRRGGSVILSVLDAAFETGEVGPFDPIPPEVVQRASFSPFTDAESENQVLDFQISGDTPWALPGGNIGMAGIVEYEDQSFVDDRDAITLLGDASDGGSAGGGERERYAIGIEASFPVHDTLVLSLAGRYDDYDDASQTGSAPTGKGTLEWRPLDNLLVRASYGTTFRAPDMQRLFGSTTRAFSSPIDTPQCLAAGGDPNMPGGIDPDDSSDPCDVVQSVRTLIGSNIDLEEEEGESMNVGIVWEAFDDFSLTLDYYDVELENIIAAPSSQFILNQCAGLNTGIPDQSFCDLITRDAQGNITNGEIRAQALNLSSQRIDGVDATIRYGYDTDRWGGFDLTWETTWTNSLETQFADGQPSVENIALSSIPEFRHNLTVDWSYNDFGATMRASYVDELPGINAFADDSGNVPDSQFVDDYIVVNTSLRYAAGDWGDFQLGVNNLFDEEPPVDPTDSGWPWYIDAGGYYTPFGREWYLQWQKRWN